MSSTYLAHHGVKGQKHGQRRWQNSDGSLTPAGRIHYGVGAARGAVGKVAKAIRKKVAPTNVELNAQIRKEKSKILNKQKKEELKRLKKTGEIEDPKEKKSGRKKYSEMSDQEINDRINRLKKEAELAELEASKNFGPGKRMVMQAVTKGITMGIQTGLQKGITSVGEEFVKKAFGMDGSDNSNDDSSDGGNNGGKKKQNKNNNKNNNNNDSGVSSENKKSGLSVGKIGSDIRSRYVVGKNRYERARDKRDLERDTKAWKKSEKRLNKAFDSFDNRKTGSSMGRVGSEIRSRYVVGKARYERARDKRALNRAKRS